MLLIRCLKRGVIFLAPFRISPSPNRPKKIFLPNDDEYPITKASKSRLCHRRRYCGGFIRYWTTISIIFCTKWAISTISGCLQTHKNSNSNHVFQKIAKVAYCIKGEAAILYFWKRMSIYVGFGTEWVILALFGCLEMAKISCFFPIKAKSFDKRLEKVSLVLKKSLWWFHLV